MAIFVEMSTQDIFSTDLKTVSFFEFQSRLNVDICFYFCFSCGDLFSCLFIFYLLSTLVALKNVFVST